MVHKGNGIINTNINQGFGVGANSNYGVGGMETSKEVKELGESGNVDAGFAFVRDKKDNRPTTAMDNFQEYMKDKQEKAKEAGEDLATKEKEAKEQAKKVSQSMTAEEVRQLEMMGIDVDSANMTDIMGMVNTLRHNADIQETAELMPKIAPTVPAVQSVSSPQFTVRSMDFLKSPSPYNNPIITKPILAGA